MRVFYFITKSEEGGAQSVIFELLRGHAQRNDSVCVMANGSGWLKDRATELGFAYVENPFMRKTYDPFVLFRAARAYREAVGSFAPDIVSCHSSFSGFVGRIALPSSYLKIYTAHGWGFTPGVSSLRSAIARAAERVAARYCSLIICVSEFDRKLALRYRIAPEEKLVTVHNGVSVGLARGEHRSAAMRVVFPARFAEPKLQELLVAAVEHLDSQSQTSLRVVFVGKGAGEDALRKRILDSSARDCFSVLAARDRDHFLAELSQADLCVLLSKWEGLPMVLIGALQMGLPVIASDVGGVSEAIDDSVGRLVPNDAKSVAVALTELLGASEMRGRMSRAASERGRTFDASMMLQRTFALYERMLASKP